MRRPEMHHSSLCAGAYLKGHCETRTVAESMCGERSKTQKDFGERKGFLFFLSAPLGPPATRDRVSRYVAQTWPRPRAGATVRGVRAACETGVHRG